MGGVTKQVSRRDLGVSRTDVGVKATLHHDGTVVIEATPIGMGGRVDWSWKEHKR